MSTLTGGVGIAQPPAGPTVVTGPEEGTRAFVGRTGSAYAALGGGLLLIALGAERLDHHLALGAVLVLLGTAELGWAVAALRGPAPLPRVALAALLLGAVGWLLAAVTVNGALGTADVAAVGLQLVAAILLSVALRSGTSPRSAGPLARLGILALGSLVAAVVTVPGLASTDAGAQAPGMPGMGSMHHGHG